MNRQSWAVSGILLSVLMGLATVRAEAGGAPSIMAVKDKFGSTWQTIKAGTDSYSTEWKFHVMDSAFPSESTTSATTAVMTFTGNRCNENGCLPLQPNTHFFLYKLDGSTFTSLSVATGAAESEPFRIQMASLTQHVNINIQAANFPQAGQTQYTGFGLFVLPATAAFTATIRTDSQSSADGDGQVALTPDRDGTDDAVVIRATPPDPNNGWEVLISTDPAFAPNTIVRQMFGWGTSDLFWYGDDHNGRTVPNNTYLARLQNQGGAFVHNTTFTIVVNTAFIKGKVVIDGTGTGIEGVQINVWGPGGGSGMTDAQGNFNIGGLKAAQVYSLNLTRSGYAGRQINNVASNSDLTSTPIGLKVGATLRVKATRQMGAFGSNPETWGNVNARTSNWSESTGGSVHFAVESSTADHGFDPGCSNCYYTDLGVTPLTDFIVDLNIHGYGNYRSTMTSPASGVVLDVVFSSNTIVKKANASGYVILPATSSFGTNVSVDAIRAGQSFPTAFGGQWFNNSQSSGSFQLFGLDPGTYTFRLYAQGFKSTGIAGVVVGASDIFVSTFTFEEGRKITGNIIVNGDSSEIDSNSSGGGGGFGSSGFWVNVNAWSPSTYQGAWTQVNLATSTTQSSSTFKMTGLEDGTYHINSFLNGFELATGTPRQITIAGGDVTQNFVFNAMTGVVALTADLPVASTATKVEYELEGQNQYGRFNRQGTLTAGAGGTGVATITGLGTGLYEVTLIDTNDESGLRKTAGVAVTNGASSALRVDMRDNTFNISGKLSLQGNLVLPAPYNVTLSSVAGFSGLNVSTSDPKPPLVQVFSFPLPQHFWGEVEPLQQGSVTDFTSDGGTFSIRGLPTGSYLVKVREDLDPRPQQQCGPTKPGALEFASTNQVIFVSTSDVSGVDLILSNGVELSGSIAMADGSALENGRRFTLTLRRNDKMVVLETTSTVSGGAATYKFSHLPAGEYSLETKEGVDEYSCGGGGNQFYGFVPKYAAAAKSVTVGAGNVTKNVTLETAGIIVGKLRDASSNTLLTSQNKGNFLPQSFGIQANANPWVPGGWSQAEYDKQMCCGPQISSTTGQFAIYRLMPGNYDVSFRQNQGGGLDAESVAKGQKAYAPVVKSGIRISAGQTLDLGTIDLTQGVTLSGTVTDTSNNPLANIRVEGRPATGSHGDEWQSMVEAMTDATGKYTLQGIDLSKKYYNVVASPRWEGGDVFSKLGGVKYGEETARMVDVADESKRGSVNFQLTEANGVILGTVATVDGGPLEEAFSHDGGFAQRRATIFLQSETGDVGSDPLGDIEEPTDGQGNFRIDALKPGNYTLRAVSKGYITAKRSITVVAGNNNLGTFTLQKGASASGTITKPDGTNPSELEVDFVAGVDANFDEFVFASLDVNAETKLVTGYSMSGFKPGVVYAMVMGGEEDINLAKENVTFSTSTEEKTINLVYKPAPPIVFAAQTSSAGVVGINFFSTHKLRNLTDADNDLNQILTVTGGGVVVSSSISGARDTVYLSYQPSANESSFKVRLVFTSIQTNPESSTGANFTYDQEFEFFKGVGVSRRMKISNAVGGNVQLEGDPSRTSAGAGVFDVESSSQIEITMQSAASLTDLGVAAPAAVGSRAVLRAQGVQGAAQRLGPSAYPSLSLYKAVQSAPSVTPQSDYYNIELPAGVDLKSGKSVTITLHYDDSITDPSNLNVFYYDPDGNAYTPEVTNRTVDTKNKTITVTVNHLSTFLVLQGNQAITASTAYTGTEIRVNNFPNPFNLKTKTVTLTDNANQATTTDGTIIKYALPAGKTGTVKLEIYTMTGDLVRTITETAGTGGAYYYTAWDGKNQDGKKVASGVYVARFTLNDNDEKFFKMAVLK